MSNKVDLNSEAVRSLYDKGVNSSRECKNMAPNNEASAYFKQILTDLKGEIDNNTVIGDFSTPI